MANLSNINNKFLVTTGGNVGINSTSPSQKLVVIGNISTSGSVLFDDNQGVNFGNSNAKINGSSSDGIKFFGSGSEKMRLTQVGNLGIGTNSPAKKLDVEGNIRTINTGGTVAAEIDITSGSTWRLRSNPTSGTNNYGLDIIKGGAGTDVKMSINSSGNVGIGTASPDYTLHLLKSSGDTEMYINGQNGQSSLRMGLDARNWQIKTAAAPYLWSLNYVGTDFQTPNIITATVGGNVGIGGSASTFANYTNFTIQGGSSGSNLDFKNSSGTRVAAIVSNPSSDFGIETNDATPILFKTNDTERMRITSDGMIGVGMTPSTAGSSTYMLQMYNPGSQCFLALGNGTSGNGPLNGLVIGNDASNAYIYNRESTTLQFGTNDSTKMVILSGGNVGIGTTSPSKTLHVLGDQLIFGNLFLQSNANGFRTIALNTANGADNQELYLCGGGTASSTRGAQVGVYGNEVSTTGGSVVIVAGNVSTGDIDFLTANTQRMIINNAGNVGIATTSPTEKLHVEGRIRLGSTPVICSHDNVGIDIDQNNNSGSNYFRVTRDGEATELFRVQENGHVGIATTNPSSELEVAGRAIVEKLEVARYSDVNAPAPVYAGRLANPMGAGGVFRLAAIESSSTVNKINEPFLITYSSGHWGCQPMFFAEFTVTYYRGSYIKYWAQHEVSGSRLEIVDGPYGGQIISGGAPVSRTITQLCTNCHGGQPVYKCVWKWSNSGTYIKTSPIVSLVDGPGSTRVYTSGSSSESAIDTLLGSAGSPGPAYLLMGINNAQAAGFTGLQTQN